MPDLEQRTITKAWGANLQTPMQFEFDRNVRILRVFIPLGDGGSQGVIPILRQVSLAGGAEFYHGQWPAAAADLTGGTSVPNGNVGLVTFSTSPLNMVAVTGASEVTVHAPIPPDLVILKGQRLDVALLLASAPGAGATTAQGPVVLTFLAE